MSNETFSELILLQSQYRIFYEEHKQEILTAVEDLRTKLKTIFIEMYSHKTPLELGKMFFDLRYKWFFIEINIELDDSWAGRIDIKIIEQSYFCDNNTVIQSFPLTPELLSDNGRQVLAEKWKHIELNELAGLNSYSFKNC